ncbi:MAG: cache domain-containing protein [Pseudomonas sp.]
MGLLKRLLWGALLCLSVSQAWAAVAVVDDGPEAKALLVKALGRYHEEGDKAFAEFSRQGEFVKGDLYVYVLNTKGVMLASGGPSAVLIGRDVSGTLSPDLQKVFKDVLSTPEANGIQESEYRWQNWSDGKVERKRVYYQRVGDRVLAVGYYIPRASPEQAKALLDKASAALVKDEKGTINSINGLKGGFLEDDLYVFVVDLKDQRYVAHGTNLRLVKTDFSKVRDPEGQPVGEPILALINKQDEGEYDYHWRNPVTNKIENKHAYIRKVDHYLVAVGYYSR